MADGHDEHPHHDEHEEDCEQTNDTERDDDDIISNSKVLLTQSMDTYDDDDDPLPLFDFNDDRYHRFDDNESAIMLANGMMDSDSSSSDCDVDIMDDDTNSSTSTSLDSNGDDDGDNDGNGENDAEEMITTPLQERRERNVRRNEQYLRDLKLGLNAIMTAQGDNNNSNKNEDEDDTVAAPVMSGKHNEKRQKGICANDFIAAPIMDSNQRKRGRRGMIFSKHASSASSPLHVDADTSSSSLSQQQSSLPLPHVTAKSISNELECKYPHRKHQIRILTSCLVNAVRRSEFAAQHSSSSSSSSLGKNSRSMIDKLHYSEATTTSSSKSIVAPSASPIMITGGSGCGKTRLVCDAVECLRRRSNTSSRATRWKGAIMRTAPSSSISVVVATAYVDCASSECDSASSAMDCAYRQLHEDYFHCNNGSYYDGSIRRGMSTRVAKRGITNEMMRTTTTKKKMKAKKANGDGMALSNLTLIGGDSGNEEEDFGEEYIIDGDEDFNDDEDDSIVEDQLERQRKTRKLLQNKNGRGTGRNNNNKSKAKVDNLGTRTVRHQPRIGRATIETATTSAGGSTSKSPRIEGSTANSNVQGGGGSVALFGRAISSFSFRGGNHGTSSHCCMFLILDNAERILSWRRYGSIHPLTQIVMLPSVMGIDLTLIFISQSSIFQYSPVHNSTGTILDAVHPMTIHFDSYTSVDAIKSVFHASHIRRSIIGSSRRAFDCDRAKMLISKLQYSLYSSMINSFVPSVISSTHDITEIVRLARLLWPEYTSPLDRLCSNDSPVVELVWQWLGCLRDNTSSTSGKQCHDSDYCSFCRCLNSKSESSPPILDMNVLKQRLSEELDKSMRDIMRGLLSSTVMMPGRVLSMSSSKSYAQRLPYVTKFLLLAAFLCQNKRAEHDINLFTTTNTGKSRKGRFNMSNEGSAHASSSKDLTQRIPSFRLERMLSVFYSIISQFGHYISYQGEAASTGAHLGTTHLFQSISMLIASKMLQISGSTKTSEKYDCDLSEMVLAKFSCTLCQDDAHVIASSVGFPLRKYYP